MSMRFGSASMMAATAAAILAFNTLSMHVSTERSKVEKLQGGIAADLRDIRALEAELRTRARLPILQTWNDNVLAMSAPTARQFADSVQLASFAPGAASPVPNTPAVQLALATPATTAVQTPGFVRAAFEVPAAALPRAVIIDYTGAMARSAKPAPVKFKVTKTEAKKPDVRQAASAAKVDEGLDMLGEAIDSAAAAERGGFRKVAMQ